MTTHQITSEIRRPATSVVPGAAVIAVTFGLARYGYGLLLPEMSNSLGLTPTVAGLISSGGYLVYLVANIGVVTITDRAGPRVAIGLACLAAATGMTVVALAGDPILLAVGVLVAGASAGLAFPPYAEVVDRRVDGSRRDSAWAAISSGTGWGVAIAGPIAIALGDHWRVAWLIFVGVTVIVGAMATVNAPGRATPTTRHRPRLSITWFLCPTSRPLLVSAVLVGLGSAVWWAFSVNAMRAGGLGETPARFAYAACGIAGIAASWSALLFRRTGLRRGYLGSVLALAVSVVVLPLATTGSTALVAAAAFGVLYPTVIAAQGIWSQQVFAEHPAAGLAAVNTALTIGTLCGPAVAGQLVGAFGYPFALTVAGLATAVALPFCPPTVRRRARLASHECRATPVREGL
ncbi:MFS transporter [Williamsia sterculiae]|uniref:Predicted arabinose efflux permease, MFS family n=1 Tax=Williamsia sterculiae TaxID=1344003 RepID=A0A1N7CKI9_9NOCA|nr:MFS transporter [Williamsia sterculiae]SIR64136.1 Predicted arabinose efflux permease, MFS family [Williamsia sterculiae]